MKSDLDHALEYHGEAFPGFAKWLAENPEQAKFIRKTIGMFSREELRQATDDMYQAETQPQGYSKHARELKRYANASHYGGTTVTKNYGPKVRDNQLLCNCWRCQDYGIVSVVNPTTLKRIRAGDEEGGVYTCVLACDCSTGSSHKMLRWDEGHCLIEYLPLQKHAIDRMRVGEFTDYRDAMWAEAKRQVSERDEDLRPKAESLDGAQLP